MNRHAALSFALGVVSTLACVFALGAADSDHAAVGRYQAVVGADTVVKIDTRTGQLWHAHVRDLPRGVQEGFDQVQIAK